MSTFRPISEIVNNKNNNKNNNQNNNNNKNNKNNNSNIFGKIEKPANNNNDNDNTVLNNIFGKNNNNKNNNNNNNNNNNINNNKNNKNEPVSFFEKKSGMFDFNLTKIILIIIILAFFGFNILSYLGFTLTQLLDSIKPLLNGILGIFGVAVEDIAKDTVEVTGGVAKSGVNLVAGSAKTATDIASGTINSGIGVIEKTVGIDNDRDTSVDIEDEEKRLSEERQTKYEKEMNKKINTPDYRANPDMFDGVSQENNKGAGGYCSVGSYKGIRSCIMVEDSTKCLSGEIFPSKEICINPSLR